MKLNDLPECLGAQGAEQLCSDTPGRCLECAVFDECHKITVVGCLTTIASGVDLIVQNGLAYGNLRGLRELDELVEGQVDPEAGS